MIKICVICKEKILEKIERWVRLTDFDKGKQVREVFYHLECWKDRFRISSTERKKRMYQQVQESIGKIMRTIPIPQAQKEYQIK